MVLNSRPRIRFHRVNLIPFINQFLVEGPSGVWLVDTGLPRFTRVLQLFLRRHLRPEALRGVILTHGHLDHSGSAAWLQRQGLPILAGDIEEPYLIGDMAYPYPGYTQPVIQWIDSTVGGPPVKPDRILRDGDLIDGFLRVHHTPGHTPGHISLFDEIGGHLICGDLMLGYGGRMQGPSAPFTYDMGLARQSALRLLDLDPEVILPGHGVPLERGYLRRHRERILALFLP